MSVPHPAHCFTVMAAEEAGEDDDDGMKVRRGPAAVEPVPLPTDVILVDVTSRPLNLANQSRERNGSSGR